MGAGCKTMSEPEDRTRFLDLIATLGETKRFLIFGPVMVGGLVYCATFALPNLYLSEAYLSLNEASARTVETLVRSPVVLDAIAKKQQIAPGAGLNEFRRGLNSRLFFDVPARESRKTSSLFILGVEAKDPALAQSTNAAIIDAWLAATKPKPDARAALESQLERTEAQLKSVASVLGRLQTETPSLLSPSSLQGEFATPIVGLVNQRATLSASIEAIKRELAGASRDLVVVTPTLPSEPNWPARGLIAALSAIAAWFAFLFVVLVQSSIRFAAAKPGGAEKLVRIRNAWSLWPRRRATKQ
jgi:uncharacterized protein involved in exopolysaccharide biosynthesis